MFNATQHTPTPTQIEVGVKDPDSKTKNKIQELLTFTQLPDSQTIEKRAKEIAEIVKRSGEKECLIGGASYLMGSLEVALKEKGITPFYSFTERKAVEKAGVKTQIFEHVGFVKTPEVPIKKHTGLSVKDFDPKLRTLNLTQFLATPEQVKMGVFEPTKNKDMETFDLEQKDKLKKLLTFEKQPDEAIILLRAKTLAEMAYANHAKQAMIGGAPWFVNALAKELLNAGITPLHAYSERVVVEKQVPGTNEIQKVSEFRHKGFVVDPCVKQRTSMSNEDYTSGGR